MYSFWAARDAALRASGRSSTVRRDSYTVVLHDDKMQIIVENDFESTPRQLLDVLLRYSADGENDFDGALRTAQSLMEKHWRNDQYVKQHALSNSG